MGYTKAYTYVDGTVLTGDDQASNENGLKQYVNQEITSADVDNDSVVGEVIASPRLVSAVYTADFISKTIQGISTLRLPQKYTWFTSTTKGSNQTSTTVKDYQTLSNTGSEVIIYQDYTPVMINVYLNAFGYTVEPFLYSRASGVWSNDFVLMYEVNSKITYLTGTTQYVFEKTTAAKNVNEPIDAGANSNACGHRSIMFTRVLTLNKGRYKFGIAVNAKVQRGNINVKTFTIETFHV